jgi:hypothetical protein
MPISQFLKMDINEGQDAAHKNHQAFQVECYIEDIDA